MRRVSPSGLATATLRAPMAPLAPARFSTITDWPSAVESLGATISASFVMESSENTFPALPVRSGENVFVWFSIFPDLAAYENYLAALARSERWLGEVSTALTRYLKRAPEVLKLSPTARSQLHG